MRKYSFFILMIGFSLLLTGCNTVATGDPIVKITDQKLANPYEIMDVKARIVSGDLLEVQVMAVNHSSSYEKLEYRVEWYDYNGFVIEHGRRMSWMETPAFANQEFAFSAVAPNAKAYRYKIYLRTANRVTQGAYMYYEGVHP